MDERPLLKSAPPGAAPSPPSEPPVPYEPPPPLEASPSAPSAPHERPPPPPPPTSTTTTTTTPPAATHTIPPPRHAAAGKPTTTTTRAAVSSPEIEESASGIQETSRDYDEQESGGATGVSNAQDQAPPAAASGPKIENMDTGIRENLANDTVVVVNADDRTGTENSSHQNQAGTWRFQYLFRRKNHTLPITNPSPRNDGMATRLKAWFEPSRGELLPDGVMQLRVAVCGFSLYGIMALLNNTQVLIKDFHVKYQVFVFFCIGIIWALTAITVGVTMSARTRFGHALSHHGTRLGLAGITLLLVFNIALMLPQNFWREKDDLNAWSAGVTVFLLSLVVIGLAISWVLSAIWGEADRKPPSHDHS